MEGAVGIPVVGCGAGRSACGPGVCIGSVAPVGGPCSVIGASDRGRCILLVLAYPLPIAVPGSPCHAGCGSSGAGDGFIIAMMPCRVVSRASLLMVWCTCCEIAVIMGSAKRLASSCCCLAAFMIISAADLRSLGCMVVGEEACRLASTCSLERS